jgi:hypothetical protein
LINQNIELLEFRAVKARVRGLNILNYTGVRLISFLADYVCSVASIPHNHSAIKNFPTTNNLDSTMTDLYVNDDIGPINNDIVDCRTGVPPGLSSPPTRPSLHDQILTAANIGIYCNHFFHNFCVWGRVYNRGVHTGPAFVPSCSMCSGIPDRRKLKDRISSQAACILADQPPDSRLVAFTGR